MYRTSVASLPSAADSRFAVFPLPRSRLALGLRQALAADEGARVVSLSSSANLLGPVVFDDLHFNFRPYEPFAAYAQSKTACALIAVEMTRRWSADRETGAQMIR